MPVTPKLDFTLLELGQAAKETVMNGSLLTVDALVQLTILDRDLSTPPGSPSEGDTYLVKATGTGTWAGHDNEVTVYELAAWRFHDPAAGWLGYVQDEAVFVYWNGAAWVALAGGVGTDAKADSSTKGIATFPATEFVDNGAGLISLARMFTRRKTVTDALTDLFEVALPAGGMAGGMVFASLRASDGTNHQVLSQMITWAAVNKAGSYTLSVVITPEVEASALSSGTLTATWELTGGTNKATMSMTPTGSLTETTYTVEYTLLNNSLQGITVL